MDRCPYDQTLLDIIGKKEYIIAPSGTKETGERMVVHVNVRVFYLCRTCGKHFDQWTEDYLSENLNPKH